MKKGSVEQTWVEKSRGERVSHPLCGGNMPLEGDAEIHCSDGLRVREKAEFHKEEIGH